MGVLNNNEVWANGRRFRVITITYARDEDNYTIRWAWGSVLDSSFEEFAKLHELAIATCAALSNSSTEKWYFDLSFDATVKRLKLFRKNAERAGFVKVGTYYDTV